MKPKLIEKEIKRIVSRQKLIVVSIVILTFFTIFSIGF